MVNLLLSVIAMVLLAQAVPVKAQVPGALWDGFVVVHGALMKDGTALACRDNEAKTSALREGNICKIDKLVTVEVRGKVERIPVLQLLHLRLKDELGPRAVLARIVGTGPGFKTSGRYQAVVYADDMFVIYYKLAAE